MAKRKYFGTDGVRDIANSGNMTIEFAMKLGQAYVKFLKDTFGKEQPKVVIGRDTRISGTMIQSALSAGMNSAGAYVYDIGVIPTPGVSYVLAHNDFDGGAVISASHNPAEYNGIKFLNNNGFKLTDDDEASIEAAMLLSDDILLSRTVGTTEYAPEYSDKYLYSLKELFNAVSSTKKKIVVDAANGAASAYVDAIYSVLEGDVTLIGNRPDGLNINRAAGVTHMETLTAETCKAGADLGIAYDGDADRILMCDSRGRVIDGDIMLWVISRWMKKHDKLGAGVVATVMSNMVLEDLSEEEGIKVFRCGVGDRYVLDKMRETGALLGGEQSGHIIALDHANTGDGISSGILFLRAIEDLNEDITTIVDRFDRYPQILTNVIVTDKDVVLSSPELAEATAKAERMLEGKGRMLLRPSGTEPMIRIFVESRDKELLQLVASMLEETINNLIK